MSNETTRKDEPDETSLSALLPKLRCDDELSDLAVEGSDGEQIRVNRCILAARSNVFRAMLFGKFSEARDTVVRLRYEGKILRAVIDYCNTDEAGILDEGPHNDTWARHMVRLAAAADYYGLPGLGRKVFVRSCSKMEEEPALSCSVYDEAEIVGSVAHDYAEFAIDLIRSRTRDCLLPEEPEKLSGIMSLRPLTLSKVLQDPKLGGDEFSLFCALQNWSDDTVESGAVPTNCTRDKMDCSDLCCRKRKGIAADFTKYIQLKRIKPSDLCETVIPSGLVQPDQLAEAFKAQALLLEKTNIPILTHRMPCWERSGSAHFRCTSNRVTSSVLLCEAMVSGVHTWTIEVESCCFVGFGFMEIGVIHSIHSHNKWLTDAENTGWVLESKGRAWHGRNRIPEKDLVGGFAAGSRVKLTLDLTGDGSLNVSIDGSESSTLFEKMLDDSPPSFLPAVSLGTGASVHFLGFQK